jgi:hypothetical protein
MKHGTAGVSLALFLASGAVPAPRMGAAPLTGSPGGGNSIAWVKDLPTAQSLARARHKLVLQFLMLGDLPDPHC